MANLTHPSPALSLKHGLEEVEQFNNTTPYLFENDLGHPGQYLLPSQYHSPAPQIMESPHPSYHECSSSAYPDPSHMVSRDYADRLYDDVCRELQLELQAEDLEIQLANRKRKQNYSTPPTSQSPRPLTTRSGRTTRSPKINVLRARSSGVSKPTSKPTTKATVKPTAKQRSRDNTKSRKITRTSTVTQPLTTLLAHLKDVSETDIEKFVQRSTEEREFEVDNSKDKRIKRPMNAFMLYRKAWQNRVKAWQAHDNHQGVSTVCGDAWQFEPQEVKDKYTVWAQVERDNHALAFPNYKFTPSKAKKASKKRSADVYSDGNESGIDFDVLSGRMPKRMYTRLEDPMDLDYRGYGNYAAYHQPPPPVSRAMSHSPYGQMPVPQNMSHYQYSNPNMPIPPPYGASPHQYPEQRVVAQYQYAPQQQQHMSGYTTDLQPYQSENVFYHRPTTPSYPHPAGSLNNSYGGSPIQNDVMYEFSFHSQEPPISMVPAPPPPPPPQAPQFDGHSDDFLNSGPNHFNNALDELNGESYDHDFSLMLNAVQGELGPAVGGDESAFLTSSPQFDIVPLLDDAIDPALTTTTGNDNWDGTDFGPETNLDEVLGTGSETHERALL